MFWNDKTTVSLVHSSYLACNSFHHILHVILEMSWRIKQKYKRKRAAVRIQPKENHTYISLTSKREEHTKPSQRDARTAKCCCFSRRTVCSISPINTAQRVSSFSLHCASDELHRTPVKDTEPRGDLEHAVGLDQSKAHPLSDSKCRIIEMDLGHVMWSDGPEKRGNDRCIYYSGLTQYPAADDSQDICWKKYDDSWCMSFTKTIHHRKDYFYDMVFLIILLYAQCCTTEALTN